MSLRTVGLLLVFSASTFLSAQPQATAAPPQTPRQALIEIITGGQRGAMKHLTVEMQKSLQGYGKNNSSAELAAFDQIKAASSEFQVFESGQVLLASNDSKTHEKFEVHVDSDDLSGDTDNLDISFHQFRDGIETDVPYAAMLSRFTVGMKQQQNVWRLNELSINIKVPLGDPKLLEKFGNGIGPGMIGGKIGGSADGKPEKPRDLSPRQAIEMVGMTESMFARTHPEIGFTCTLADLAKPNLLHLDPRIFSGEPYRGYKFSLSGCQDKPSGSFHLIAEPVSPTTKVKAYCTDATNNVRSSDDGSGSSCLASGKMAAFGAEEGSVGWDPIHVTSKPTSK
ncbi:MAG TPA: hypothetical protein VGJ30_07775 [Candidatus Angelobacter sp.]|jgi:hypothetical protein